MKISILFILMALTAITLPAQTTGTAPEQLFRVRTNNAALIRSIERGGITVYNSKPGEYVDVAATPEQAARLRAEGAEVEFLAVNEQALYPMTAGLKTAPGFHTYASTNAELVSIHNTYPAITSLDTIGQSLGGRAILCLKVSDNPASDEDETPLLFCGNHHGNEVHSVEVTLANLQYLVTHYGTNPEVTQWVNNMEIWFVPMVNPDGREAMRRTNNNGVDLNRNYSFGWTDEGNHGTAPFSEPETRAIRDFTAKYPPAMSVSYHTSGNYFLYSWTHSDAGAPDSAAMIYLGTIMSDSVTFLNGGRTESYTLRQGGRWYFTAGEYCDYMYVTHNTMAYTVELGFSQSPDFTVVPAMIAGNLGGFRMMLRQASRAGVTGRVTDAFTGLPVRATIDIPAISNQGLVPPRLADSLWGRYYRYLQPGDYTFRITAPGFRTVERTLTVSPDSLTRWDIQLERSATLKVGDVAITDGNTALTSGNGDGYVNPGEMIGLSLSLLNEQAIRATAAYAKLSSDSPYVKFLSDYLTFGDIEGNQSKFSSDMALFRIDPSCPDNEKPIITATMGDAAGFGWIGKFSLEVRAPKISIASLRIEDPAGNGNGVIEAGETAVLVAAFVNQGRQGIHDAAAVISTKDIYFQVVEGLGEVDSIGIGETREMRFIVSLPAGAPKALVADFSAAVSSAEGYAAELTFSLNSILGFYDAFEDSANGWTHDTYGTSSNTHNDWQLGDPAGKAGDAGTPFSGAACWGNDLGWDDFDGTSWDGLYQNNQYNWLRSPVIDCSALSGTGLKFMRWLTIRTGDRARVKVNGQTVWESEQFGQFDTEWTPQLIDISSIADHNPSVYVTFELETNSTGTAGGWNIDDFILADGLAGGSSAIAATALPAAALVAIRPNPVAEGTVVGYVTKTEGPVEITIINQTGVLVKSLVNSRMPAGDHQIVWDGHNASGQRVPPGVYLVRMRTGDAVVVRRVVVE